MDKYATWLKKDLIARILCVEFQREKLEVTNGELNTTHNKALDDLVKHSEEALQRESHIKELQDIASRYRNEIDDLQSSLTEIHAKYDMLRGASGELADKYNAMRQRFFALFDLVVNNSDGIDWKSIIRNH